MREGAVRDESDERERLSQAGERLKSTDVKGEIREAGYG